MSGAIGPLVNVGIPVLLILIGLIVGGAAEARHFRDLKRREGMLSYMLVTDLKSFPGGFVGEKRAALVMGEAVIASDYLKSFLAGLRRIIGGRLNSYQSLLTRGRREALLRMMERARQQGYDAVCNVRIGTATIGRRMIEVHAWGTAYQRPERPDAGQ